MTACRLHSESLGIGPTPGELLRLLAGRDGLACLWGSWAGGGAILLSRPVRVLPAGADPAAALGDQPALIGADTGVVGGGWFGVIGYDADRTYLAFYDHLLRFGEDDGEWHFEALWSDERDVALRGAREELHALLRSRRGLAEPAWHAGRFAGPSIPEHLAAVEQAIELIRAGELYQVNICTRMGAPFEGTPAALFADAAARLRPAYAAFVDAGDFAVASLSPELFLRRRGDLATTSPIKGTVPRNRPASELRRSAKDAAENVMIVDLMRNDLGRVAETGSVHVDELLSIEAHPGVWHLVSTVTGRVHADDAALLRATFPPGSVTGAPKLRALEVIAELERSRRGAYTGAIGFASPSWGLELNVAIRTFEIAGNTIELGVGGGITVDSVPMLEWRECLHKAMPLLGALATSVTDKLATPEVPPTAAQLAGGLLETILAVHGVPVRLADHLARLDRSCRELYGTGIPPDLAARVRTACAVPGRAVVRVVVRRGEDPAVSVADAPSPPAPSDARVVTGRAGLWRHKWAARDYLEAAERDGGTPLFVSEDGTVLETSRGNVFLVLDDGTLVTPPLRDDLLPGVTRRALLDTARDLGRRTRLVSFGVEDVRTAAAVFWTSSVSGLVPVAALNGSDLRRRDDDLATLGMALGFERDPGGDQGER